MQGRQLPLEIRLREHTDFASFVAGSNEEAVSALRSGEMPVVLSGSPGSGRTHLLQAASRLHHGAYLPLREIGDWGPEVLDGHAGARAVYLDDLDHVHADRDWCASTARLIDVLRQRSTPFAIALNPLAEDDAPIRWALLDLATRLDHCLRYTLRPLDDTQRAELLQRRASARGLVLTEDVLRWLLRTQNRDPAALLGVLDRLDRASLTAKRRLTLPLVQATLQSALLSEVRPGLPSARQEDYLDD